MKAKNKIVRLRHRFPLMSNAEIGRKIGVSRNYVREVLQKNHLITRVPRKIHTKYCEICGIPIPIWKRNPVCSSKCRFLYFRIRVTCTYCRVDFYLKRGELSQRYRRGYNNIYCSQSCFRKQRRLDN